jgi:hypothetical protein
MSTLGSVDFSRNLAQQSIAESVSESKYQSDIMKL